MVEPTLKSWGNALVDRLPEDEKSKGPRSKHFWIIAGLMALATLCYYVDQTPLAQVPPFNSLFFGTVHDVHRTLFLIPILYATLVFRIWGSLVTSLIFLVVVIPRALLFSPYPDALLRPLVFVAFTAVISFLIAAQIERIMEVQKAHRVLENANQELEKANRRLQDSQVQIIRAEKLSLLGEMSASFAHEANNPLAAALVLTKLLSRKINDDKITKEGILGFLTQIDSALTRGTGLMKNLLTFSRKSMPLLKEVNIYELVNQACDLVAHLARVGTIEIVKDFAPDLPRVMVDPDQIQQICTNLIVNGIQAMPQGGRLTLRIRSDGRWLNFDVIDTGVGISPENMKRLFTPFFTTKANGVGLGLAVSQDIIHRHNGRIDVRSKPGEGTTFTVCLPCIKEASKNTVADEVRGEYPPFTV